VYQFNTAIEESFSSISNKSHSDLSVEHSNVTETLKLVFEDLLTGYSQQQNSLAPVCSSRRTFLLGKYPSLLLKSVRKQTNSFASFCLCEMDRYVCCSATWCGSCCSYRERLTFLVLHPSASSAPCSLNASTIWSYKAVWNGKK
jgi:hypothetical protein